MAATWWDALPSVVVAVALVTLPGAAIILAGWGRRGLSTLLLLAPALSVAVVAIAATAAPVLGLDWSPMVVVACTVVIAAAAWGVRRVLKPAPSPPVARARAVTTAVVLALATAVIAVQVGWALIGPDTIAQAFDNIVHLNSVAYAVQTLDASPFHIGETSDIGFYPNGWHSIASLTAVVSGSDIPTAVNVTNLVVASVIWPASMLALTAVLFPTGRVALLVAGGLSTGFGAFPALFLYWGPLYPNALGYAMIPAVLAAVAMLCRARGAGAVVRGALLVLLVAGGSGLAHPNAFLAAFLLGGAYAVAVFVTAAIRRRDRVSVVRLAVLLAGLGAVFAALWPLVRTSAEHSWWPPWTSAIVALGKAVLGMPLGWRITPLLIVLIVVGLLLALRRLDRLPILLPFAVAAALFVVSSGFAQDDPVRQWLTNPWYNDSNRFAALLPIVTIPIATLGAVGLLGIARRRLSRRPASSRLRSRTARAIGLVAVGLLAFSVAVGTNVTNTLATARATYDPQSNRLLSPDERSLLAELDDLVPEGATIAGSPRTGTSLAYALGGRDVIRKHVFGTPGPDEVYLNQRLRDIDTDPAVCSAVDRLGIDYVLDFGSVDVFGDDETSRRDALAFQGLFGLRASDRLELVDAEGTDAKLYRIVGC